MKAMTDKKYTYHHGLQCPAPGCRSEDLEGNEISIDGGVATQEMTCLECGASWMDVYKLVGYSNLNTEQ